MKKMMAIPAMLYLIYILTVPVMAEVIAGAGPVNDEAKPLPILFVTGFVAIATIVLLIAFRPKK